jgi:hypothetical protein
MEIPNFHSALLHSKLLLNKNFKFPDQYVPHSSSYIILRGKLRGWIGGNPPIDSSF